MRAEEGEGFLLGMLCKHKYACKLGLPATTRRTRVSWSQERAQFWGGERLILNKYKRDKDAQIPD